MTGIETPHGNTLCVFSDGDKQFELYVEDGIIGIMRDIAGPPPGIEVAKREFTDIVAGMKWCMAGIALEVFYSLEHDIDAWTTGRWAEAFGIDPVEITGYLGDGGKKDMEAFNG